MEKKDISPQIEVSKCDLKKNNSGLMKSDQLSVDYVRSRIYSIRGVEVMVDADQAHLIRERETIESLWERERLLP